MNYQKEITEHLSGYKKEYFPTLKDGYYRGEDYAHILPSICGNLNLLEIYRDDFLKNDLSKIKFHQGFHHLNSSQAMCINFFFPLFIEEKLEIILQTLGFNNEDVKYDTCLFEKESDIDSYDGQRATNFDFYFETLSGKKLYFEIKYTENEFGKAKSDDEHKKKYEQIYEKAAKKTLKKEYNTCEKFLENYQKMRNLIHISKDSYVVLIYPEQNEKVNKQANEAKEFLLPEYQNHLILLTWDELYEQKFEDNLEPYFEEFKKKYKL